MRCFVENKVTTACNLGARAEKMIDVLFYYAGSQRVELSVHESSQVYTETTDNHTEAYRMCSGSQQGRTGVDGDGGGGPSRVDLT